MLCTSYVHYNNTENIYSVSIISKTKLLCIILLLVSNNSPIDPVYAKKYDMLPVLTNIKLVRQCI